MLTSTLSDQCLPVAVRTLHVVAGDLSNRSLTQGLEMDYGGLRMGLRMRHIIQTDMNNSGPPIISNTLTHSQALRMVPIF